MKLIGHLFVLALLAPTGLVAAAPMSSIVEISDVQILGSGALVLQANPPAPGCTNGYHVPLGGDEQERRRFSLIYRLLLSSGFSNLPVVIVYESESPDCLVSNVAANY